MNGTSRIGLPLLTIAGIVFAAYAAACGGSSADPASTPVAPATVTPAPSPTPDPVGEPVPDGDRAFAHARMLAETIGARPAGTAAEIEARDYIAGVLRSFGYDVAFQEFPFDDTQYLHARVDAGAETYSAIAFRGAQAGVASGQLIDAGLGRAEDYPPSGINGAVALIQRGEIEFREKAANAEAAGASGAIVYNNVEGTLFGSMDGAIPVVGIRKEPGEAIAAKLAAGAVEARVEVTPPTGTAYNIIAKPPGTAACRTVTGGHFDSVPVAPGASDNASGTASVIELARVLMAAGAASGHCFVLFGAEEVGLLGSRAYVASLTEAERTGVQLMVNLDVVGTEQGLEVIGSPAVIDGARLEAENLGIDAITSQMQPGGGSDHISFDEAGIPVIFLYRDDIDQIHRPEDAIGRLLPQALEDTVLVARAVLLALPGG